MSFTPRKLIVKALIWLPGSRGREFINFHASAPEGGGLLERERGGGGIRGGCILELLGFICLVSACYYNDSDCEGQKYL